MNNLFLFNYNIMTSKIIELKQTDTLASVYANGDYMINTKQKILVPPNSQIVMKNAFLDTSAFNSQQIILPQDITLDIDYVDFLVNNKGIVDADNTISQAFNQPAVTVGNGMPMFRCNYGPVIPAVDKIVTEVIFNKKGNTGKTWGNNQQLVFQYTDWNDNLQHFHITIPTQQADQPIYAYTDISIKAKNNSVKDITITKIVKAAGYDQSQTNVGYTSPVSSNGYVLDTTPVQFTVPRGIYQPSELAATLSQFFQGGRQGDFINSGQFVEAPFLKYQRKQDPATSVNCFCYGRKETNPSNATDVIYQALQVGKTEYWSGASQMALEYDQVFNKFKWTFNITPNYDASKELSISRGKFPPFNPPSQDAGFYFKAYDFYEQMGGGVIFTSLRASLPDGTPSDFWTDILGFDLDEICVQPSYLTTRYGARPQVTVPDVGMATISKTITAPDIIADMGIVKGSDYQKANQVVTDVIVSSQTPIYASKQVLESTVETGFYFIDVETEFSTEIIGTNDTFKHTVGIVSNFYNENSFTTGTSADAVVYNHRSDYPIYLSGYHIRILDSDRNLASNLGQKNVIFLEIQQNIPPLQPLLTPKQEKELEKKMDKK